MGGAISLPALTRVTVRWSGIEREVVLPVHPTIDDVRAAVVRKKIKNTKNITFHAADRCDGTAAPGAFLVNDADLRTAIDDGKKLDVVFSDVVRAAVERDCPYSQGKVPNSTDRRAAHRAAAAAVGETEATAAANGGVSAAEADAGTKRLSQNESSSAASSLLELKTSSKAPVKSELEPLSWEAQQLHQKGEARIAQVMLYAKQRSVQPPPTQLPAAAPPVPLLAAVRTPQGWSRLFPSTAAKIEEAATVAAAEQAAQKKDAKSLPGHVDGIFSAYKKLGGREVKIAQPMKSALLALKSKVTAQQVRLSRSLHAVLCTQSSSVAHFCCCAGQAERHRRL
jgi:hypothetical protein